MDDRHGALTRAFELAGGFLETLGDRPVWPRATYEEMLQALGGALPAAGSDPVEVVAELARLAEPGLAGIAGGRFFGFVIGGELPAALGADWLTSVWDQNAGLNSVAPAAAAAEAIAGQWMVDALGLPRGTAVGLTTGGMMANYTCLSAARHEVLARQGWDVNQRGLFEAPRVRVVVGRDRHDTIDRAARFLGLGADSVREVDTDSQGRLDAGVLATVLEADEGPVIVCLQAGEVHTGAFDPFADAIEIARRHDAWVHVDGAFGLWAAASPRYRHLLGGVEGADSWATDGHKWLNVPYDCGYAFVADPEAHSAAMSHREPYLQRHQEARDQMDWNPEWSRRARGFSTYAALRQLGRQGIAALVEQCCGHARSLVLGIGRLPGAEVVWEPTINQGLVRFLDAKAGASGEDHDRRTDE